MRPNRRCIFKLLKERLLDEEASSGTVLNLIFQQKGTALNFSVVVEICQPNLLMMLPVGLQRSFEGRYYPAKRGTSYGSKIACLGEQPSRSSLKLSEESLVSEWDQRGWFAFPALSSRW